MDLKTFVKETLTQIAEGVNEAKPQLNENGMQLAVEASALGIDLPKARSDKGMKFVSVVNFEAVLGIETTNETSGGISVLSSIFSMGGKKGKQETSNDVTKVSFSVALTYGEL
jgi:hypothetical protein